MPNYRLIDELACEDKRLFIDDFDLAPFTTDYAEQLYRLIDYRVANEMPVVVILHSAANEFVNNVAGRNRHVRAFAEGISHRLRDSCDTVDFDYDPSQDSEIG
ncbi:MAG: hypothetical protein M3Y69_07640 [Verrucomicrobiota bacterium]|nr:hypothetical protein [Verrucomicrobiota bacterium]